MSRFPSPLSALSETVTGLLEKAFPERHTLIRSESLEGDASDRKYFRLTLKSADTGASSTYVLMQLAEPWIPERAGGELPFVNIARHLAEKGVPVPGVYLDASEKGMILLEDIINPWFKQNSMLESAWINFLGRKVKSLSRAGER